MFIVCKGVYFAWKWLILTDNLSSEKHLTPHYELGSMAI
jgi:hypothetical protein